MILITNQTGRNIVVPPAGAFSQLLTVVPEIPVSLRFGWVPKPPVTGSYGHG
jgi:hypothetical protein